MDLLYGLPWLIVVVDGCDWDFFFEETAFGVTYCFHSTGDEIEFLGFLPVARWRGQVVLIVLLVLGKTFVCPTSFWASDLKMLALVVLGKTFVLSIYLASLQIFTSCSWTWSNEALFSHLALVAFCPILTSALVTGWNVIFWEVKFSMFWQLIFV